MCVYLSQSVHAGLPIPHDTPIQPLTNTTNNTQADMDVEAFEGGVLASILTGEGETANVGSPVALLAVGGG